MFEKIKWFQSVVFFCVTLLLVACSSVSDDDALDDGGDTAGNNDDGNNPDDSEQRALNGEFISSGVTIDGEVYALVEGTVVSLDFDDGVLVAHAGCNSMSGTYTHADGVLNVSQMAMTEMGCDTPRHDQDQWVADVLSASPTVSLIDNVLTLTASLSDGSNVVMELVNADLAIPDKPFVGTDWVVDTIIDGDTASTSSWANPATLTFYGDGTVDVFAGCNFGSGTYTLTGDSLVISELGVTEMACEDAMAMELENFVLDLIYSSGALTVEIDQNRLTLMGDSKGLGLVCLMD